MSDKRGMLAAIVAGLTVIAIAGPALADCYDLVGCDNKDLFSEHYSYLASIPDGPNCDFLFMMRNRIYQRHGLCFQTPRAISMLGNDGCHINDRSAVRLSSIERANVEAIVRAEQVKACKP